MSRAQDNIIEALRQIKKGTAAEVAKKAGYSINTTRLYLRAAVDVGDAILQSRGLWRHPEAPADPECIDAADTVKAAKALGHAYGGFQSLAKAAGLRRSSASGSTMGTVVKLADAAGYDIVLVPRVGRAAGRPGGANVAELEAMA